MNLTGIVGIILLLIILYALFSAFYYFNPEMLNNGDLIDLNNNTRTVDINKTQMVIGISELTGYDSIRYFYDGWLRINSSDDNSKTYSIFNNGNDFVLGLTGHKLSIIYPGISNRTNIPPSEGVKPETGILNPPSDNTSHTTLMDIATNFPFQKWVYFCICVDENVIDAYLNGKLVKSVSNPKDASGAPIKISEFTKSGINIGNIGVRGKIARFRREPRIMNPQSVWNVYIQGPGTTGEDAGLTGDYHARIKLVKDNNTKRKYELF